jgi:hypothetical protein
MVALLGSAFSLYFSVHAQQGEQRIRALEACQKAIVARSNLVGSGLFDWPTALEMTTEQINRKCFAARDTLGQDIEHLCTDLRLSVAAKDSRSFDQIRSRLLSEAGRAVQDHCEFR